MAVRDSLLHDSEIGLLDGVTSCGRATRLDTAAQVPVHGDRHGSQDVIFADP